VKILFQTPGLIIFEREMLKMSQNFTDTKNISALESLVDISKNFAISREAMLSQLIKGHVVMSDWTKAVNVFKVYEDEMITPYKSTVDFLVSALERNNQEIPAILENYVQVSSGSSINSSSNISQPTSPSSEQTQDKEPQQSTSPAGSK